MKNNINQSDSDDISDSFALIDLDGTLHKHVSTFGSTGTVQTEDAPRALRGRLPAVGDDRRRRELRFRERDQMPALLLGEKISKEVRLRTRRGQHERRRSREPRDVNQLVRARVHPCARASVRVRASGRPRPFFGPPKTSKNV